jgi:hypothetical protein
MVWLCDIYDRYWDIAAGGAVAWGKTVAGAIMKSGKWVVIGLALGMMAATAGWLAELRERVNLGAPGVKVDAAALKLYRPDGSLMTPRGVTLPEEVAGFGSWTVPPTAEELTGLPEDTTFGRRYYTNNGFGIQVGVVLMGRDHTSIHQPQYCLYSQDWEVTNTERIVVRMERPHGYDLPAIRLDATHPLANGRMMHCIYIYWFVSGDKIVAEEGSRLWSMWKSVLGKGVTERWAYISYFAACHPGEESDTFQRLEEFIKKSVPEFQTVAGAPTGSAAPVQAGK